MWIPMTSASDVSQLCYDPKNQRVHQFVLRVVESPRRLVPYLERALELARETRASRVCLRAIVKNSRLQGLIREVGKIGFRLEASVPLADHVEGFSLVYISKNDPARRSLAGILAMQDHLLEMMNRSPKKEMGTILRQSEGQKVIVEKLGASLSERDVAQIESMCRQSLPGYGGNLRLEIERVLERPERFDVLGARNSSDGKLCAVQIAETVKSELTGIELKLCETILTVKDYRALDNFSQPVAGLGTLLGIHTLVNAARKDVDLAFCESRSSAAAVNFNKFHLGMSYRGRLWKPIRIKGKEDVPEAATDKAKEFGNLNVWAMTRPELKAFARRYNRYLWEISHQCVKLSG